MMGHMLTVGLKIQQVERGTHAVKHIVSLIKYNCILNIDFKFDYLIISSSNN